VKHAFDVFIAMLQETRSVLTLYDYLCDNVHTPIDYSDLLRWQWMQAVSALDKFIHDIVRIGMSLIYQNIRPETAAYKTFSITIELHTHMMENTQIAVSLFEQQIQKKNSYLAFQDPDKISEALSYIWDEKHKWQAIADNMGLGMQYVRAKLHNISDRRNQIVHEGDYSDALSQRQAIERSDVVDVVDFIEKLGTSIYHLVSQGDISHAEN
jgi:hypothetical protein